MKRFLYYFIWTIGIGLVLYFGMQLQGEFADISQRTFNVFPLQAYIALFPVLMGVLMRLPKWMLQKRMGIGWSFDWPVFLAIGCPSFLLVLMAFVPFIPLLGGAFALPRLLLFSETTVPTIAGVTFGYVLLNCFEDEGNPESLRAFKKYALKNQDKEFGNE